MKSYGSCSTAIPDTRHVPLPTKPVTRDGNDIVSRLEAKAARRSPIVLRDDNPKVWANPRTTVRPRTSIVDATPIVQRYQAGQTMASIAKELGHSTTTVRRALADHGITIRRRQQSAPIGSTTKYGPDVRDRVVELVKAGATYTEAALHAGCSPSSARTYWRAAQQTRKDGIPNRVRTPAVVSRQAAAVRLYLEGLPASEVARRLGYSRQAVTQLVAVAGVTRSQSDALRLRHAAARQTAS